MKKMTSDNRVFNEQRSMSHTKI